jgi:isoleucyl-tRNA synthetase
LPTVASEVLDFEERKHILKSITTREGNPPFVFSRDRSANGLPGIHHVMARLLKIFFADIKTKGIQVKRKAGWDTHGLPVE